MTSIRCGISILIVLLASEAAEPAATSSATRPATQIASIPLRQSINQARFSSSNEVVILWEEHQIRFWRIAGREFQRERIDFDQNALVTSNASHAIIDPPLSGRKSETLVIATEAAKVLARIPRLIGSRAASLDDAGRHLLLAGREKGLEVWSVPDGRLLGSVAKDERVQMAIMSPDARVIICKTAEGRVSFWNAVTFERVGLPSACVLDITSRSFSADGRFAAVGIEKGVRVLQSQTGDEVAKFDLEGSALDVQMHPGGKHVLIDNCGSAVVYDIATGKQAGPEMGRSLFGQAWFDKSGRYVIVNAQVEDSGIWDWKTGKQLVKVISRQWDAQPILAASDDASMLLVRQGADKEATLHFVKPDAAEQTVIK